MRRTPGRHTHALWPPVCHRGFMPFADELIGAHTAIALTTAIQASEPERPLNSLGAVPPLLGPLSLRERSDLSWAGPFVP